MPKVYLVNGSSQYRDMFLSRGWQMVSVPEDADLIQFTGGEDVDPSLYGEKPEYRTHFNTRRDVHEMFMYHASLSLGQKMAGICRGGQFLHVMNGGKLRQHVDGHGLAGTHNVYARYKGNKVVVPCTSTHHQQMVFDGSRVYSGALIGVTEDGGEEIIYHHQTQSLCFQPHPEFSQGSTRDLYFKLLESELGLAV